MRYMLFSHRGKIVTGCAI